MQITRNFVSKPFKMKCLPLVLFSLLLTCSAAVAQQSPWTRVSDQTRISSPIPRVSTPETSVLYHLDVDVLAHTVDHTPNRFGATSSVVIDFPDGYGEFEQFRIYQTQALHPVLAAKYPQIKTYVGQGIRDKSRIVRFSITPFGLHAMVLGKDGTSYIDPYSSGGYYMAYLKKGMTTTRPFACLSETPGERIAVESFHRMPNDNGNFRTYRMAMACTTEYSDFHIAAAGLEDADILQQKAAVLSAMTVTVERMNSMFERDLSVSFQLVEHNDELIFIGEDNFNNEDVGSMIDQGTIEMNNIIGFDNYDIGHTVGTSGGGLGGGSPCTDGKAVGATGTGAPVGDPFDIDYVSHEVGHQFGAGHTFNNACGGNVDPSMSYEPGSGSSIMAYAGICDPNVQSNSDAQFHAGSIAQIRNRINGVANCAAITPNGNTTPFANAGADYIVPQGTALLLKGSGIDPDDNGLTYSWEQYDKEISMQPPLPEATEGPNFRVQVISDKPERYLPSLSSVLANDLAPTWEVIPTVGRTLNFAMTVRDNNMNGGESNTDFMTVTSSDVAGPFVITYPNSAAIFQVGSNKNITWNVAGTDSNGVDTHYVDIVMSHDGGQSFTDVLALHVPNDGSEIITVPNFPGNDNRIMVRANGNIFFDVNNQAINIPSTPGPYSIAVTGTQFLEVCKGTNTSYTFHIEHFGTVPALVTLAVDGAPEGTAVNLSQTASSTNADFTLDVSDTFFANPGLYMVTVTGTSGSFTRQAVVYIKILDNNFAIPGTISPADEAIGVAYSPVLQWTADPLAELYTILVDDDPQFQSAIYLESTTNSVTVPALAEATTYYWMVRSANNACNGLFSETAHFTTGQTECDAFVSDDIPVEIPEDEVVTVQSQLVISESFPIHSATVWMDISHTWLTDIAVKLISPDGNEISLFSHQCGDWDDAIVTFSDAGLPLVCTETIPTLSGTFTPETPLSALSGEMSDGAWTLEVYDEFALDGGAINAWGIDLCRVVPALSLPEPLRLDFGLYPNPNNGTFTILRTLFTEDAGVAVYDLRGRKVYDGTAFAGNPEVTVSLQAESGVYLVELEQDGLRMVKKFVIR